MYDDAAWLDQLANRFTTIDAIAERFPNVKHLIEDARAALPFVHLPFAVTPFFLKLARDESDDPILKQILPSTLEAARAPGDLDDPLGERVLSAVPHPGSATPRVVRQYRSRVLVRACGECPVYCRHCFRRGLDDARRGFIPDSEIDALRDLLVHEGGSVREVLISGGDPLIASDDRLARLLHAIRTASPAVTIRLCTRTPVTLPHRFTPSLVRLLADHAPLWLVAHINHPHELSPESRNAFRSLLVAGVPALSQTVLLRGVNDSVEVLEQLFSELVAAGIKPYYLFQGDLAPGTAHLRAGLGTGLRLYAELRRRLSGLELPRYAVDAPGGGGKIYLPEGVRALEQGWFTLETADGDLVRYPDEP